MITRRFSRVLFNILATGVLAAVFVMLFVRAPYWAPHEPAGRSAAAPGMPAFDPATRAVAPVEPSALQPASTSGPPPGMGLFSGQFAGLEGLPEFSMEEHSVQGGCVGAGRRYLEAICPGCAAFEVSEQPGQPSMLVWTENRSGTDVLRSVTTDCVAAGRDGEVVVGTLALGGGAEAASGQDTQMALDIVPLLPGSRRLSALEMGGWLATIDEVEHDAGPLDAMAKALRRKGWQDVAGQPLDGVAGVEEQRVFRGQGQSTCVIYLSRQAGATQLVTLVSL